MYILKCICPEIEIVVKCIGVSRSGVDGWQLVELAASAWQPCLSHLASPWQAQHPLPLLPIHLDFILRQHLQRCFIFIFLCLHFCISAPPSSAVMVCI